MKNSLIPGFVLATRTITFAYFPPPRLPPGYVPLHRTAHPPEGTAPAGVLRGVGAGVAAASWASWPAAHSSYCLCQHMPACTSLRISASFLICSMTPTRCPPWPLRVQPPPSLRRPRPTLPPTQSCARP